MKNKFVLSIAGLALVLVCGPASANDLLWSGPGVEWDTSTANWSGDSTIFDNGDTVSFGSSGPSGIVIQGGGVSPLSTTFLANAQNYTFTGGGINGGSLNVFGGLQTFNNGANTLTGNTNIFAGGTLALTGSATLANTTLNLQRGTLRITGNSTNTRLSDSNAVTLHSGSIFMDNGPDGILDETVGILNFSGTSRLDLTRGGGGPGDLTILRIADLNRVDRGILEISRAGADSRTSITVTGTAPVVTNGMVSPHFIMFASTNSTPSPTPTFATYISSPNPNVTTGQFAAATASGTGLQTVLNNAGNTGDSTLYFATNTGGTLAIRGDEVKNAYAARFSRSFSGGANTTLRVHGGGIIMEHATDNLSLDLLNIDLPTGVEGVFYTGRTAGQTFTINGVISGDNGLTKGGVGTLILGGANTYTGNTTVTEGGLTLTASGELRFELQDGNNSNKITGTGSATLDGIFRIDADGLTNQMGQWKLVDVDTLSETFGGNFGLQFTDNTTFAQSGTQYTSGDWTFDTTTGYLVAIPEPGTLLLLGIALGSLLIFRRRK
ncbi:MAG: PEP-CTERM sorting domain-containing protein [Verrucomicrobia bacterium]|nr:PEP-CTERM sorting domain-containing protein [Verrucomicrobiota bacterium]MCH8510711.1 PEP-CTERM sorting domain-containing protein [Kiritimatiellia bacterium]